MRRSSSFKPRVSARAVGTRQRHRKDAEQGAPLLPQAYDDGDDHRQYHENKRDEETLSSIGKHGPNPSATLARAASIPGLWIPFVWVHALEVGKHDVAVESVSMF